MKTILDLQQAYGVGYLVLNGKTGINRRRRQSRRQIKNYKNQYIAFSIIACRSFAKRFYLYFIFDLHPISTLYLIASIIWRVELFLEQAILRGRNNP